MKTLSAAFFFIVLYAGAVAAQAPQASSPPPMPQPAPGFVTPKTPWGDPDLQGFWPGVDMVGVPMQRPARFGTRNVLTDRSEERRVGKECRARWSAYH